jgi:glutaredoxin-like protein
MERMLNDQITAQVKSVLGEAMVEPVRILFFESPERCEFCQPTRQILEEILPLDERLSMEVHDIHEEADLAKQYGVDKTPAIVLAAVRSSETVDYGIPSGHEFTSLINDIILVSQQDSGLTDRTREFLRSLNTDVHLQVFVTPTCPYCPRAVTMAHAMALESPRVQADMIEATEFDLLSAKYQVGGVPHTAINDSAFAMIGSGPEEMLVEEIQKAIAG